MPVRSPSSAAPPLIVIATLTLLSGALLSGCRCACGEAPLVQVVAQVPLTELSRGGGDWTAAAVDDGLEIGDALRTGESGRATLAVRGQGTVRVGPGSLVRFGEIGAQGGNEGGLRLTLETGELEVDASESDAPALVLGGPGGQRIHLDPGTRLRMQFDDAQRLRLDITEGATRIEGEGEATELGAGESFLFGDAERLETETDAPSEPTDAGVASDAASDAGDAGDADLEPASGVTARNLGRAEVEVRGPEAEEFSRARRARLTLEPGTAVQVTGGEGLELRGPEGATVTLQPGARAVVRGIRGDRLMVGLSGGRARAASSGAGVADLTVPGGAVETENTGAAPAFLATVRDRRSTRVNVTSGAAVVTAGGRRERVLTGAEVIVGEGRLSISRTPDLPPVMSSSGILFDPQRQGAFTIRFQPIPECELYVVEVDRNGRRYTEALTERPSLALANVEYGEYQWRAGCLVDGEPSFADAREGRISRYPDRSGHVALPTKAPRSTLDTDGRTYTVTYQNRLPALTLRWSQAPEAPRYTLEVTEDRTGRRVHRGQTSRPVASFRSGFFNEGRYFWFFRAEGGERRTSPITWANISFDNVAPTVQIVEPREGASASGTVRVRGVATVGSRVRANGVELDLTGDYRFDQQVPLSGNNLLVITVTTRRGTGHYLRHLNR